MKETVMFPAQEYTQRIKKEEKVLERAGFDALLAYSVKSDPGSLVYLTGSQVAVGMGMMTGRSDQT